ncbi:DUF2202 domain-containing protein [Antarcticimicrobium luteum]|uniref:DUF2202 domain-containing protein n=1 Tax=Antarcticimicrobium luteum TaxID=2547397 RepID=A0A4R5V9W7_9RHOB|nr:DUF2202 domain-containing protein [Antarcticimicrobium luteum]TDK48949.1 DUF2202 domain-containing protein [Antarcticimicrobium luteum]
MKKAAFKSAGGKFQFKHKFGDLTDGPREGRGHDDDGPETDVLSAKELTGRSSRGAGRDADSETDSSSESGHHGHHNHHRGGHHGGRSSEKGDKSELSGTGTGSAERDTHRKDGVEVELTGDDDGDTAVIPTGGDPVPTATATYSDAAIAELLYMIEEEKLAGDIYEAFHEMYGLKVFENIAESEDQHFNALIEQAEPLGIDVDQFVFEPAGTFSNPELQEMYDTLLAQGSESVTGALEVGKAIEERDMVDIAAAIEGVEGTKLATVYDNLLTGSSYHLDAFDSLLMA